MNWHPLEHPDLLAQLQAESKNHPVIIFKHSTRCSISSAALDRFQRNWNKDAVPGAKPYYLDLIRFRETSNAVADVFGVYHQSPQALVIQNGKCIYDESHFGIDFQEIAAAIKNSQN
ncbi:MAG: bacillithiol system redox-active protein YtxJ [Cyclobacteriaceae bacterium]|nr:bacillithiol system redox-active protein YtxJ [Cyclobacteriaceae bacterium]